MAVVNIKGEKEVSGGWEFWAEVLEEGSGVELKITLDKSYWEKLTGRAGAPAELIKKSVEFLLQREPKESILKEFNCIGN